MSVYPGLVWPPPWPAGPGVESLDQRRARLPRTAAGQQQQQQQRGGGGGPPQRQDGGGGCGHPAGGRSGKYCQDLCSSASHSTGDWQQTAAAGVAGDRCRYNV